MNLTKSYLIIAVSLLICIPNIARSESNLYTQEMLQNMADNIAKYDWAQKIRDEAITNAARYLEIPDEEIAKWVPDPRIPRSAYVHETACPNCGLEARKFGNYPWIITEEEPYKLECPSCGKIYPSNDYQAFVDSGFQDRSLLTGDHADDGWGWVSPEYGEEQKYWFVAWYNHWMVNRRLRPAIQHLRDAYLYTGDPRYAHKCAVLLWQLAEYYPDYDYARQSRNGLEINPNYHGRLLYHTWETFTMTDCATAYGAIASALTTPDPELEQLTGRSTAQVRELIEEQLLRSMASEVVNETGYIAGNYGMHQMGLLQIAADLQGKPGTPSSQEMIEWILDNEEYNVYTMMPLYDALSNLVLRDGVPFESPSYNLGWVSNLTAIAELLRANGVDVTEVPRFKKLYDWVTDIIVAGQFTPSLGDSGNISNRGRLWREEAMLSAYRMYKDPLYARILLELNADAGQDIFAAPITEELKQAAATIETEPGYDSSHLAGYGLAILQNSNLEEPIAASLFYGYFVGHSHRDKMHLDLYANGASLLPDFGYPETANSNDPRRAGFFAHTVSHNTVMVDETCQATTRGRCEAYDSGPVCQYVEAQNDGVYPQCSQYRRSVAMIDIAPGQAYVVDVFRVDGGRQHDWLVHGTHADFESNLDLSTPREGTLAGPEVEYGYYYDDEKLAAAPYGSTNYFTYRGSGFQFLYNVQEAPIKPDATARWNLITSGERAVSTVRAKEGAFLKAFLVGEDEQIFACDGKPQQNQKGSPESVKFLVRRRAGDNLRSTFTTVFEPGANEGLITSVTPLATSHDQLVALRIELASGHIHYYFNSPTPVEATEIEDGIRFAGQVGFLGLDQAGEVEQAYLYNATLLARGAWSLSGDGPAKATIASCDYDENSITLADPVLTGRMIDGMTVTINTGGYSGAFEVMGTDGARKLLFGDQEPMRSRAYVKQIKPEERTLVTPTIFYFIEPGMHLVSEAYQPIAQLDSWGRGALIADRDFTTEQWPDADGDGVIRAYIMEYGPGDEVMIPSSIRYKRP